MVDVMSELRSIGGLFRDGNFVTGMQKIKDLWAKIPDPKTETSNAYLIVEYAVAFALKNGDLDEAWEWANIAPIFSEKRQNRGEAEFLLGKVAFERSDFELARKNFLVANRKSRGRIFKGENPKYQDLIKK